MQTTTDAASQPAQAPARDVTDLLPSPTPVQMLDEAGRRVSALPGVREYDAPTTEQLVEVWRRMVVGRRLDVQCTALTKQGRLAVYPSSRGQDACQVAGALALQAQDWFFPTYRDCMALFTRGIDPVEVLSLLRGDSHCGWDVAAHRTAPHCTPLSTQLVHAAGAAYGERRRGSDAVAMAFIGDGATSEGDFHEALNFAAVFDAPVVFLVQNNKYAISVPLAKQSKAPALAYKGIGYGIRSEQVDGNDPVAMLAVLQDAVARARAGGGPFLLEAHTYRLDAHTNADDATRYRTSDEVTSWLGRDPIHRLQAWLVAEGHLTPEQVGEVEADAERQASDLRDRMNVDPQVDPMSLFEHVYAEPTPAVAADRDMVAAELEAERESEQEQA